MEFRCSTVMLSTSCSAVAPRHSRKYRRLHAPATSIVLHETPAGESLLSVETHDDFHFSQLRTWEQLGNNTAQAPGKRRE
jgi:hypothetical protein